MTSESRGPNDYTDEEKRILLASFKESPLDEGRIRETVRRAWRSEGWWRGKSVASRSAAALLLATLLGAVYWVWDGIDSQDLTFTQAVEVLRDPDKYTKENLLAGIGKVERELSSVLAALGKHGSATRAFCESASEVLQGGTAETSAFRGDLERLKHSAATRRLHEAELQQVLQAVQMGVAAIRSLEERDDAFETYSLISRRRMLNRLAEVSEGG